MRLVADLHIHSRFSLATSSKLTATRLEKWARIKGIDLLGTGDCTHPTWLAELADQLQPVEEGLFSLKPAVRKEFNEREALAEGLPDTGSDSEVRFVLTGEICTIFSRGGKTRKVHHLVILPDFTAAAAFQTRLARVAKIESDGRPILGLDSRDLFEMLLEADDRSILVPAHIWTPWFSALGGRSGFDSIDECYLDLAPRIGAIETGLSSNPPMNWAVSALDRFAIISNSDAHSPEKLGREATLIDMELSFAGLADALSLGGGRGSVAGTVEFFPQEGKYHYDGHRACGVVLPPEESGANGGKCPVCGKPLTPGVLGRVCELADQTVDEAAPCPADSAHTNRRPYRSLIPLKELLSELLDSGEGSKKVTVAYGALVEHAGSEFGLLLDKTEKEIEALRAPGVSGELLAQAVARMREGRISVKPGYDGEYGEIRVFAPGERIGSKKETGLFAAEEPSLPYSEKKKGRRAIRSKIATAMDSVSDAETSEFRLDAAQERAVNHPGGPALIIAGPGTGKTAVLARRIERLVGEGVDPASILALTFTNKAAAELRQRIAQTIGEEKGKRLTAATFHSFCRSVLRDRAGEAGITADFSILNDEERTVFLETAATADKGGARTARKLGGYIEERKRFLLRPGESSPRLGPMAPKGITDLIAELGLPSLDAALDPGYAAYRDALRRAQSLDFDDLVAGTVRLFAAKEEAIFACRERFRYVFVDEFQDVNFAQYALIRLLVPGTEGANDLCVIGDPNQAIYGFRGADRRFIDRFLIDYPGASTYRLAKSFRCAPTIIGAANRLVGVDLVGSGAAVVLSRTEAATEKAEAELIAREIDRLIGGTRFFAFDSNAADSRTADAHDPDLADPGVEPASLRSLGECAILVRAAALATPIETALRDHGIPYVLVGEQPWWEEEPAKTLIRSLRSADLRDRLVGSTPVESVRFVIADTKGSGTDIDADTTNRLFSAAQPHNDLDSFLDSLALGAPQDGYEKRLERVTLMTIHAAKGLEFDHVFVAGLEEGILPFTLYDGHDVGEVANEERIEEERRLLYVAITRARVGLHLSMAKSRTFRGRKLTLPPSRFLVEIEDLLTQAEAAPGRPRDPQMGLF
jgi:uncharacterized protein (TIGR00375 family)